MTSKFIFSHHTWSPSDSKATFHYTIEQGSETFHFVETLVFPKTGVSQDIPETLLNNILDNLLLVLGISYYKLFCSKEIVLQCISIQNDIAEFWQNLYTKGLGEFFYKNQIDFRGLINFPVSDDKKVSPVSFPRQDRSLVSIGGGKDSVVAAEMMKKMKKPFTAFVVNDHPLMEQHVQFLQVDKLVVERHLDPQLFELNKREDTYNGHIPVSAQWAFIGVFAALLFDYRYVVVAIEESANYGSTEYLGQEINHAWSKSLEFERMFSNYIKEYVTPDVKYFSLLRPFSELAIIKEFVKHPQYFPHFSSCNNNFKITQKVETLWCCECPKCAFVFLMLAAFLPKEKVVEIFGQNLFTQNELLQTYKELLGVTAIKPFDCVGTPDEVKAAFYLTHKQHAYDDDPVMQFFVSNVLPNIADGATLVQQVLTISGKHNIPEEFQKALQYDN